MYTSSLRYALRAGMLLCAVLPVSTPAFAQSAGAVPAHATESILSLDTGAAPKVTAAVRVKGEASFENAPPNFRAFASAKVGEEADAELLTLRFAAPTKLTKIEATKDFRVKPGGSCAEGNSYSANGSCTLLVQFTPQGAGTRLGKITISHTASAIPFAIGLGGNGYAPVISFTPALITTVGATYPAVLNGAQSLAVDGNDTLYIADTGNNLVRYIDSSGTMRTLVSGYAAPRGITTDTFGEVYFDLNGSNHLYEVYDYGPVVQIDGTGTGACTAAATCNITSEALSNPGLLTTDGYNRLFFPEAHSGAAMITAQPTTAQLAFIYDPFPFQENPTAPIGVDTSDNLYSPWANGGNCEIVRTSLYSAENNSQNFTKIAGGHTCGFAGDGGQAGNAEIGNRIGGIVFDLAGNLYFSDTANQRVRRIDAITGQINTIAGTGTAGYGGDNGQATNGVLSTPTGVAVDSQGQVYILSSNTTSGTTQVIRKLGPNGYLAFGGQARNTSSSTHIVTVSNTGNSEMQLTKQAITGTNPSDFSVDTNATTCLLTAGSYLYAGQSCKIGVIFKPTAGGTRTANLVLLDNSVTGTDTVRLSGIGNLPAPTFTITSPAASSSTKAGTAIAFSVSVTSTTTPAPTGTVTMLLDGGAISGSPSTLNASGVASLTVNTSVTGTHTLSATYNGDANFAAAGPITRTYTVTTAASIKLPTTITLSSSANPASVCSAVSFVVAVTGQSGAKPTGTVQLKSGTAPLGSADLSDGVAKFSVGRLPAGSNSLTASYSGDSTYQASASPVLKQLVALSTQCGVGGRTPPRIGRSPMSVSIK